MSLTTKSQRQIRKRLQKRVENTFDLDLLDYKKRAAPLKYKSKILGLAVAAGVYGVGFGLAYFGWKAGITEYDVFAKVVWIFMIPASVVGAFVFLISANRREYSVLKDVMAHAADVEGQQGMLWRFGPLFDELGKSSAQVSKVLTLSREGRGADIEPEDYAETVRELYAALSGGGGRSISAEAAGKVESNLAGLRPS